MKDTFKGKDILVTGGAGSIGSEIVRQLLDYDVKRVRVLDNSESGLFHLEEELCSSGKDYNKARYFVGDVRDLHRIRLAIEGVDIVFHAAALKHVPLCEYNPYEAVKTNVLGTENVLEAARDEGVEKLITISTDKAVNPINTMGATKLLAEKITLNAGFGEFKTMFSCVRFGNVLNSDGSVIPIFKRQIAKGGPVTITADNMTRFFMSMSDAVSLVLKATEVMKGREIFILKMNAIRITDLAEAMIEIMAPKFGHKPRDIKMTKIGKRPGEKLYEELLTEEEIKHVEEKEDMYVLRPGRTVPGEVISDYEGKPGIPEYNSKTVKKLGKDEIKKVLERELKEY
ncbi:MAG: polysaccharide biosynthesis protein [Candidatus Altiarchaeota archaeon]|nr:polysaccharide biosynthesis protein [Candidatus Altiarchaeota archaeon]